MFPQTFCCRRQGERLRSRSLTPSSKQKQASNKSTFSLAKLPLEGCYPRGCWESQKMCKRQEDTNVSLNLNLQNVKLSTHNQKFDPVFEAMCIQSVDVSGYIEAARKMVVKKKTYHKTFVLIGSENLFTPQFSFFFIFIFTVCKAPRELKRKVLVDHASSFIIPYKLFLHAHSIIYRRMCVLWIIRRMGIRGVSLRPLWGSRSLTHSLTRRNPDKWFLNPYLTRAWWIFECGEG